MDEDQGLSLTDELQLLEKEYIIVAMTAMSSLNQDKVPPSYIHQHILNLPQQSLKLKYKKLIERKENTLSTTSSIDQLFLNLSPFCDFLNPDLLEEIIEKFGDKISSTIIDMYIKKVRDFRRRTRLCDISAKWVAVTPPGYVNLTLEMHKDWRNKTLEDLEVFRSHVSRLQWFLKRVDEDGLKVTFSVPEGTWVYQEDLINLKRNKILAIKEDRRCVVKLTKQNLSLSPSINSQHPIENPENYDKDWRESMTFVLDKDIQFGFHRQAGNNVFVSRSSHKALMVDVACGPALAYGAIPLSNMAEFEVRLLDHSSRSIRGSLKMGVMRRKLKNSPLASIPKLSEHRDNSCMCFKSKFKEKTEFQNNLGYIHLLKYYGLVDFCKLQENDCLGLQLSPEGDLSFFVNGINQGVAAHDVYQDGYEVYCFIEMVEGYKSVEIIRAGM